MREFDVWILTLSVLSILPSLIFTLLSGLAFRQNWAFWYYNFSFASFAGALFLMLCACWVYYAPGRGMAQGYILLIFPLFGLLVGIGLFLPGLLTYPFWDFKNAFWTAQPLPSYPFWASAAPIIGFELIWLLLFL